MKKLIYIFVTIAMSVSCYESYIHDYEVLGVGFANTVDVRTVVVGEGMKFSTGVALGGTISNTEDRSVKIGTDMSLVSGETLDAMKGHLFSYIQSLSKGIDHLEVLPLTQYEMKTGSKNPGEVIIGKGSHLGKIEFIMDSVVFLSSGDKLLPRYIIPLRITDASPLSVISGHEYTAIGVRYENMLFGNWWHGGVCTNDAGQVVKKYYTTIPQEDTQVWTLTTESPFTLTSNAVGPELNGSTAQMKLTLNSDKTITISSVDGAKYVVEPDGESRYNKAGLLQNRKIFLKYKFSVAGQTWHACDTLTFRNRERDGVNEWQDENSSHYID